MNDWTPLDRYLITATICGQRHSFPYVSGDGFGAAVDIASSVGTDVVLYREHSHASVNGNKLFIPCTADGRSVAAGTALPSDI